MISYRKRVGGIIMATGISPDKHFYDRRELFKMGYSYYKINKLVSQGQLNKLTNNTYENGEYTGEHSDFAIVSAYAPKSVFCMMTSARFYGLTTFLPDRVDIAIERSMKISTLPDWPDTHVWYFPDSRFNTGVTSISDETGTYRMYDIEKTVVDILYYRNKIGIEETREVLKNYLGKEDRDLIKLRKYANDLGCGKILGTYLEVLL